MTGTVPPADRPGRPRSARADRAILKAALDLLIEQGFDLMSMEGIASRAGVGKTTIYRRYASKEEVVAAVLSQVHTPMEMPDTGDLLQDLLQVAEAFRDASVSSIVFPVIRQVLGLASTNPRLFEILNQQVLEPRRAFLKKILQRAVERGQARGDADLDWVIRSILGVVFFHALFELEPNQAPTQEFVERLIHFVWNAVRV